MTKRITTLLAILAAVAFAIACAQTDAGITGKIKSKLAADDTVKAYQIDVDTKNKAWTTSRSRPRRPRPPRIHPRVARAQWSAATPPTRSPTGRWAR